MLVSFVVFNNNSSIRDPGIAIPICEVGGSNAYACVIKCLLTERIKPDVTYGVVFRHLRVVVKIVK